MAFNGFSEIDLDSFGSGETAAVSVDSLFDGSDTTLDGEVGGSSDIFSLANPGEFYLVSTGGVSNNFRVRRLVGNFTTTAVPEPSSLGVMALGMVAMAYRRRTRQQ